MHRYLSYNTMSLRGGLNAVFKSKCMIILAILQGRLVCTVFVYTLSWITKKVLATYKSHQMVHWLLAITSDGALATCDHIR